MTFSQGLVDIVKLCNKFNTLGSRKICKPFIVDGKHVGLLRPAVVKQMIPQPDVFIVHKSKADEVDYVELNPVFKTFEERSEHVTAVIEEWRKEDLFCVFKGWRNESLNIWDKFSEPPLLKMERVAVSLFGAKQYGAHINGFLVHPERGLCMWIATRAMTKPTWPGKFDQMAAGALASTDDILGCAKRESQEEASVPDHILENLKPVGTISYFFEDERGLFPETQFVFDLEVPIDFVPVNADGEVGNFTLMDVAEIKKLVVTEQFKFNCALCVVDFFIRHSIIKPDEEPNYTYLVEQMHISLF